MKTLMERMAQKQFEFSAHPFFTLIDKTKPKALMSTIAQNLSFWIQAFQDLLILVEKRVEEPQLKELARLHGVEDLGHNIWFKEDLKRIGISSDSPVYEIYSKNNFLARATVYQLMAETFQASDDRILIALLMSLESSGHIFFGKMSEYTKSKNLDKCLKYFSHHHLGVELGHSMFIKEIEDRLMTEALPVNLREEGLAMVDRTYSAFKVLFDEMFNQISIGN